MAMESLSLTKIHFFSLHLHSLDFLPMAAFFFIANVTIPSLFLMPSHETTQKNVLHDESTPFHFRTLYCSLMAMAALIIFNSLIELYDDDENENPNNKPATNTTSPTDDDYRDGPNIPMALFLVTIWIGPILGLQLLPRKSTLDDIETQNDDDEQEGESLIVREETVAAVRRDSGGEISLQRMRKHNNASGSNTMNLQGSTSSGLAAVENDVDDDNRLHGSLSEHVGVVSLSVAGDAEIEDENKNLLQMLQTPSALLMLWTTTIIVGGGIVETNNMGQMVEALYFPRDTTSASLAFFSVAQAGSRVITGALSESALNWPTKRFCIEEGIPRTFFLVIASVAAFIAHMLLSVATTKGWFVIGAALAGVAFGMAWPIMVLVVGEVFGTDNVGANYMFFDGFTSAAGSVLLSKFVAQEIYEQHVDRRTDPDNVTCYGKECFSKTHFVVAMLSFFCILTSFCLVHKTKHIYERKTLHKAH